MKKECERTQSLLHRYLKGHLFLPQLKRVERHLASCAICRSQLDSLQHINETQQYLSYLSPPEGLAGRLVERISRFSGITRIFFRPLWLLATVAISAAVVLYVITPLIHDPDLEKLDAGPLPPPAAQHETAPLPVATPQRAAPAAPEPKRSSPPVAATPKADPLLVTITVEKESEKASLGRINEAMKGHPLLASLQFSDKIREVSGKLTPDELYTFFSRIRDAGKITYKRSRLASAAKDEQLPFVLKLQSVSAAPRLPVEQPAALPAVKSVEQAVESTVPEIPATKPEDKPATPATTAPH